MTSTQIKSCDKKIADHISAAMAYNIADIIAATALAAYRASYVAALALALGDDRSAYLAAVAHNRASLADYSAAEDAAAAAYLTYIVSKSAAT